MPLQVQVGGNTRGFEVAMARAQAVAAEAAQEIQRRFKEAAKDIALSFGRKLVVPTATLIAGFIALRIAINAVTDAVRAQIAEILELADKANKVGVSPGFFQAFLSVSKNLRVEAGELEKALAGAFQVLKDKVDPNWTVFDTGTRKAQDFENVLRDIRELFSTSDAFTGLALFRAATTQEDRIRAVLTAAVELERIGQRLVALDLLDRAGFTGLADQIRRGNTSAEQLLNSLSQAPRYTSQLIEQTKEVDRQLQQAQNRLSQEMTPTFARLIEATNTLKAIWKDIVSLTADFIANLEKAGRESGGSITKFILQRLGLVAIPGAPIDTTGVTADEAQRTAGVGGGATVPFPRARPSEAPREQATKSASTLRDALERLATSIERENGLLENQIESYGKSNVERERSAALVRIQAAEQNSGRKATEDETKAILAQAEARGKLLDRMEAQRNAIELQRFAGQELINALDRALEKGANFADIVDDIAQSLRRAALQAIILGSGPLAGLFGTGGVAGSTGGLVGLLTNALIPRQHGGPVWPNQGFVVGERGPELFVPNTAGRIVSNGAGTMNVNIALAGANGDETIRQIAFDATAQGMRAALVQVPRLASAAVTDHMRRRL